MISLSQNQITISAFRTYLSTFTIIADSGILVHNLGRLALLAPTDVGPYATAPGHQYNALYMICELASGRSNQDVLKSYTRHLEWYTALLRREQDSAPGALFVQSEVPWCVMYITHSTLVNLIVALVFLLLQPSLNHLHGPFAPQAYLRPNALISSIAHYS